MTQVLSGVRRRKSQAPRALICGLGTATPWHLSQEAAAAYSMDLCCDTEEQRRFLTRIYEHSGVESRGAVLARENDPALSAIRSFYRPRTAPDDRGPTTAQRMVLYTQYAPQLAETAGRKGIESAGLDPSRITHLIPVTCTGFFSPGLDYELITRLGLTATVTRAQLGFMGCHGAFNALATARDIVRADPHARVLVCCVELCSLHLAYGPDPQKMVANALFADGAAAAVIGADASAGEVSIEIDACSSYLFPGSADAMTWRIGDHGFEMTLSPSVPQLLRDHLMAWLSGWLTAPEKIPLLAIHPGGPKILTAVRDRFGRDESAVAASRSILRDHGNMSSATILFVIDQLARSGASGKCLALGFGPGLIGEGLLLNL